MFNIKIFNRKKFSAKPGHNRNLPSFKKSDELVFGRVLRANKGSVYPIHLPIKIYFRNRSKVLYDVRYVCFMQLKSGGDKGSQ